MSPGSIEQKEVSNSDPLKVLEEEAKNWKYFNVANLDVDDYRNNFAHLSCVIILVF